MGYTMVSMSKRSRTGLYLRTRAYILSRSMWILSCGMSAWYCTRSVAFWNSNTSGALPSNVISVPLTVVLMRTFGLNIQRPMTMSGLSCPWSTSGLFTMGSEHPTSMATRRSLVLIKFAPKMRVRMVFRNVWELAVATKVGLNMSRANAVLAIFVNAAGSARNEQKVPLVLFEKRNRCASVVVVPANARPFKSTEYWLSL